MAASPSADDRDRWMAMLADLAVGTAINLQPGQELLLSAPIEASPVVRHVVRSAYLHGARAVTCVYEDPALIRERLTESSAESLGYAPPWLNQAVVQALRAGAARLQLVGPYPDLLTGIPFDRIVRAHEALAAAGADEAALLSSGAISWSAVPVATGAWATQVFPELPEPDGCERLWSTLFAVMRVADADPRQAWDIHVRQLNSRRDWLQDLGLASLRFFDGRTDLTVGLAPDHQWRGGSVAAATGVETVQSLPCEEVFTALDGRTANGRVIVRRPVSLGGTVVRNLYAEFQHGAATTIRADSGAEFFERLIGSGNGRRLGEVGLVGASSLVGRSGVNFWNPLLDRNAASHVAFGDAPAACRQSGRSAGGGGTHELSVHIDCILGHDQMHVDGTARTGDIVPLMRNGEFVRS
jgi:aminopeptidase